MPKVLLWNAYAAQHAERLRKLLTTPWEIAASLETEPAGARADALSTADALVSSRFAAGLPPVPRLRLIQAPTSGFDRIEPTAVPEACVVCNVHEHEAAIAEYVLAAMLQWLIRLPDLDARFRAGDWNGGVARSGHMHGELGGRTLGILGYGRIGREVSRRAKAFGMCVVAATRTPRADAMLDRAWPMSGADEMLAASDFVLVACPLNEDTRGLIDARRLARMKSDAVLINVSRAAVVDEMALYAALSEQRIGGAILDVWYAYPTPEMPDAAPSRFAFQALANVVMTPHASAWTQEMVARRWRFIAANLDRLARGERLENIVIEGGRVVETR